MMFLASESEQERNAKRPLLPIRFSGLFGRRPVLERVEKTPEPSKVEAPPQPTESPVEAGKLYPSGSPQSRTRGIEEITGNG